MAGALGAEVRDVNLNTLDERGWRDLHAAFLEYSVLAVREQKIEPADLMRIGGRFGEPCYYPFVTGIDGFPFIFEVVKEESETVNFGGNWHSDTTYLEKPPLATLLYALETPKHGGDTLFSSTSAAYDALSEGMRAMVDKLVGVNSASLKATGGRRKMHSAANVGAMKIHDTENADSYEAEHPVARTHPETGRK
ncbi:MAG TPA: TauD/TfdA family dioxygenase, partial [Burkholderiales bacterium]